MCSMAAVPLGMAFFALLLFAFSNALTVRTHTPSLTEKEDDGNSHKQEEQQAPSQNEFRYQLLSQRSSLPASQDTSEVDEETARQADSMALATSDSFLSQAEKVAEPIVELRRANGTSEAMADNVTQSSQELHNMNVTSGSLVGAVSNSTTDFNTANITLGSAVEKLTNSPSDVLNTNMTISASQLTNTSGSVPDFVVADFTLGVPNTTITSLSHSTNKLNSSSQFANTVTATDVKTANMSNSNLELVKTNVTSNAKFENVSLQTTVSTVPGNRSHVSTNIWAHNQDTEAQSEHGGLNVSRHAELINETGDSFSVDKNDSCPDSGQDVNVKPDMVNHTHTDQLPTSTSSRRAGEQHTLLGKEDYDYGIDDPTLNHSSSEVANGAPESGCPTCRMRAIDRHYRILQFKNRILSSLQITTIPNVTGVPIPKVPALTHLYEMDVDLMSDPSNGRRNFRKNGEENDDDFLVKTERVFIGAKEAPLALHLNLTDTVYFPPTVHLFTSEIKSAYLWFYIRKRTNPPASLNIELIVPQSTPQQTFGTKKLLSVKLAKQKAHGWKRIDLTTILSQWIKHPMTNFGLLLKAEDKSGNNLIVLPYPPDVDKGYEPCLDTKIIESRHNSRRRRSESLMCVENSTDSRCCRHPLIVGFAEFGWDWIIAPTHVNADYCIGECRLNMNNNNTPYYWVNQQVPGTNSCCTPTKLSPLPLMYFDENMHIVYQILQNMKVDKCGCS